MTLDELKAQATKILAIEPATGYTHETFSTRSGGTPRNRAGVPEVRCNEELAYETVANGVAYRGSVTVECRNTGARDADGRTIYEASNGVVFVYDYSHGSPESFDSGRLIAPKLT